jgi:CDP-glycerol glycerophosphotransferase (TagB/SpsB family)
MKFLAYLVCYCIYPFSFLFPRNRKKWAYGSFRGGFDGNAKYLFIHVSDQMPEIDAVWLSTNKMTVKEVRLLYVTWFRMDQHVLQKHSV